MKRSEMIMIIKKAFTRVSDDYMHEYEAFEILQAMEEAGILPPVQTPSLVEDTLNGGQKHGPAQRVWDEE